MIAPAAAMTAEQLVIEARRAAVRGAPPPAGAASELGTFIDRVATGEIYAAPLPWRLLNSLTQALVPGSVTVICGDPGAGKTFFVLDCLRFWTDHGYEAGVFFVEKNRRFYLNRLLAQEEGRGHFTDLEWIRANGAEAAAAVDRHRMTLDAIGGRMTLERDGQRATLRSLYGWVRDQLRDGRRILVIDPITAADAGTDRWRSDDGFMVETQKLLSGYGASLVLVTHPRKGNVTKKSGHDMAAGAAYFRFSDTTLWINRLDKPRRVKISCPQGFAQLQAKYVVQIHKAREGRGTGAELVYSLGEGMHFMEHGIVVADLPAEDSQ